MTLEGSSAIFTLAINGVYTAPQQIQGFATDDAFATTAIKRAEVLMGVDQVLSGGFVAVPIEQNIFLQADSASNDLFDQWDAVNQQGVTMTAQGIIILPGIQRKWTLTKGFLTTFMPTPAVKKLLQRREFGVTWESLQVSPA
jgi:hypothetical protein